MGIPKFYEEDKEKREYLEQVWLAWQEWQGAINLFENALEPEMVEFAVYNMEAKRRQYMFMVKYAKDHLQLDAEKVAQLPQRNNNKMY